MKPLRKAVTLLVSYFEVVEEFPSEEMRQEFVYKVYLYGVSGQEPEFNNTLQRIAWKAIKPVVEHSLAKYDASVKNGAKGGRPPRETQSANGENPAETQPKPSENPAETQKKAELKENRDKENRDKENRDKENRDARMREDWRHLSSARLDYLRTNGISVTDFKRSLLLEEVKEIAPAVGLSKSDIEAFMQKWGESSPGSDKIRAEYEPTFNVQDRAKNYVGVGRPDRTGGMTVQQLIAEEERKAKERNEKRTQAN